MESKSKLVLFIMIALVSFLFGLAEFLEIQQNWNYFLIILPYMVPVVLVTILFSFLLTTAVLFNVIQ